MRAYRPLCKILSATISQQTFTRHLPWRLISSSASLRMMSSVTNSNSSSSNPSSSSSPPATPHAEQPPQAQSSPLPLPEPSSRATATQIPVGGEGIKLDLLAPIVVNEDGTLGRVANWGEMAEFERDNLLRIIGKRNRTRMNALKARAAAEAELEAGEWKGSR
ncbi:hypothetical protein F5X99DRAFT_125122 [Biscogniauxia marginata]|nr:hypothetical protein F5X99DRAFT_125122 [Biscogniauxia marginata]